MAKKKKLTTKQRQIKQDKNFLISENKKLKQKIEAFENGYKVNREAREGGLGQTYIENGKRPQTKEQRQEQRISRVTNENAKLRIRVKKLETQLKEKDEALKNVLIRMAELEKMIFGEKKKGKKRNNNNDNSDAEGDTDKKKNSRDKSSYCRPTPSDNEVTDHEHHKIDDCLDCGTKLTKKEIITRFIEDIRIPLLDALDKNDDEKIPIKKIVKQTIERGYCKKCRQWRSPIPLTNQRIRIGPNVRKFVAYVINVQRLTYSQAVDILLDLYNFKLSDGEITNILNKISETLKPEFARIKERILEAKSIHIDETSGKRGKDNTYSWVLAPGGESEEAIFLIGKNRGGGNAKKLLTNHNGDLYDGVVISDCYPAYKNIVDTEKQQKCWPHITRKSRDLANNSNLPKEVKPFVKSVYANLSGLYAEIREISKSDFLKNKRLRLLPNLLRKFDTIIQNIRDENLTIKKLNDLANSMEDYRDRFFTCIKEKGVVPDNNKAERKIRGLVIKRKTSFGTKTEKGDKILEINYSVLMSAWWQDRKNFFTNFHKLVQV